jgi:hypothetical protein
LVCGPSRALLRNREAECDGGCRATRRGGPRGITGRRPECRSEPMVGGRPAWTPYTAPGSKPCKPRDPDRRPPAAQRNVCCCGCPASVTYRWSGVAFDHRCSDRCRRCPACFVHRCGDGRGCGLVPRGWFQKKPCTRWSSSRGSGPAWHKPEMSSFSLTLGLSLLLSPDHEFVCTSSRFPSQSFRSRFSIRQGGSSAGGLLLASPPHPWRSGRKGQIHQRRSKDPVRREAAGGCSSGPRLGARPLDERRRRRLIPGRGGATSRCLRARRSPSKLTGRLGPDFAPRRIRSCPKCPSSRCVQGAG